MNVMCGCSFNMTFLFVYTGWEGTANDSRVFFDAIARPEVNFLMTADGTFILVMFSIPT